jgi:hypothetical protein
VRSPWSAAAHSHVAQVQPHVVEADFRVARVQPRVVIVQGQDDCHGEAVRSLGEVNSARAMNSPDDHFAGPPSLSAGLRVATKLASEIPSQACFRLDDQLDD